MAGTVEKFDSAHAPVAFSGIAPDISEGRLTGFTFSTSEPLSELAVDSTSHDFYVLDHGSQSLRAFQSDGEPALFSAGPAAGTNTIGGFSELCGVAVDSNGDIYTGDYFGGIHVYASSGELLTSFEASGRCNVAVDSHGTVYSNGFGAQVIRFVPSEFPVTSSTTYEAGAEPVDSSQARGVAVSPLTNHLFVDEVALIAEYDETGQRIATFGGPGPGALTASEGIAVDSATDRVYASDAAGEHQVEVFGPAGPDVNTGEASEVQAHSATLNATVSANGKQLTDCHFDYGPTEAYGKTVPCTPSAAAIPVDTALHPVSAEITGLEPGVTYNFRLVAENANNREPGTNSQFTTSPTPSIDTATATNLTATTVDLNITINPRGTTTTYHLEYGPTTAYGTTVPVTPEDIGAGVVDIARTQHVTGLTPNTLYHWRVLATNNAGTTTGVDHTFIYPTNGSSTLPDGRAYEMITPTNKNAALLGNVLAGLLPAVSVDGSRLILSSLQCFGDVGSCIAARNGEGTSYAFSRTSGGWAANALAPPAALFEVNSVLNVNADNGSALFSMPTPPHGQDEIYARRLDGSLIDIGPVTPPELGALGPSGVLTLATKDYSHVVIEGPKSQWPFDETIGVSSVIEFVGSGVSHPVMVGVRGGAGSSDLISVCGTNAGGSAASAGSAMSSDGQTVFFTAARCGAVGEHAEVPSDEAWARLGESESVELSASECGSGGEPNEIACRAAEGLPGDAAFQGGSVDGSKAFFTSTQQLTDSASEDSNEADTAKAQGCSKTVGVNGCNLYEYDFSRVGGRGLVTVSAGDTSGGGPRVQGVVAIADDGSRVYFVARGVLSGVANGRGLVARDGGANLYVFERDGAHPGGVVRFIATLSDTNVGQGGADAGEWIEGMAFANVSSDGRFLVFTSQAPLTADDIRPDGGAAQIFRYDDATGELVRVSIGEGGFNDSGNAGVGDARIVAATALSRFVGGSGRRDPSMSDDGRRVFFMSPIALTPGALNDVVIAEESGRMEYAQNIYEFEDGHVSLISGGRDVSVVASPTCGLFSSVCLVGVDVSGDNVFFTTTDRLVAGDTDTQLDFYDARVCTAVSPCVGAAAPRPAGCLGEVCHGVPVGQPGVPDVASATLTGLGNLPPGRSPKPKVLSRAQKLSKALKACRRSHPRSKRLRVVCERSARKRYAPKTVKKTKRAVGADVGLGGVAAGGAW
jgi:hypothetical protein